MTETTTKTLSEVFDDKPWAGFRKDLNRFLATEKREPWSPVVDFFDTGERLVLQAELPGVDERDVRVRVADGTLEIHGWRHNARTQRDARAEFHRERRPGSFRRLFTIPVPVNEHRYDARLENGLLTVTLPKTKQRRENHH